MIYQTDNYYTFPVKPGNPADEFFMIEVNGPDGPATATLKKLEFQKDPRRPQPLRLECRVCGEDENGLPVLGHAISSYVNELYKDIHRRGESFECAVVNIPANPAEEPYGVIDRNGIFFRVHEPGGFLAKGQKIRCKFKTLSAKRFEVVRVDQQSKLPFMRVDEIAEGADLSPRQRRAMDLFFAKPEFDAVRAEIAGSKPKWPLTASGVVRDHLNEWFVAGQMKGRRNVTGMLLEGVRKAMLYLLEGSNYLNGAASDYRESLQRLLTEMVEGLTPYQKALRLFEERGEDSYVEGLFDKLQKSGYLYHPASQFAVMMLIFRVNPDKVSTYLNRIFESIFTRDVDNWNREPFRSAFVEQFEIYVRQARRDIDSLPLAETREQKLRLETIITALALEIILGNDDQTSSVRSLFYRYVSLLRPLNKEALLTKSFLSLMHVAPMEKVDYAMLREPMMMMTRATVLPEGNPLARIAANYHYTNGTVDLLVNEKGIRLFRSEDRALLREGAVERVLPDGLMSWLNPQIMLQGVRTLSGTKLLRMEEHARWWSEIENSLFAGSARYDEPAELRKAAKDDEVYIVIDGIAEGMTNDPTFECHIQHEGIEEGRGILKRSQIVNYNLRQPSQSSYIDSKGNALGFLAKVIDLRPDGTYVFSLNNLVSEYIAEVLNFNDEYTAVITGTNVRGYGGISSDGIGLYLKDDREDTSAPLTPGTIVRFRLYSGTQMGNITGSITAVSTDEKDHFDKTTAFAKLMNKIGVADEGEDVRELEDEDIYEFLSADDVREIVEIIRFGAIAESDLTKAYDYLRFARLMALAIGADTLADTLQTHAQLLVQHRYYAANKRVDKDALEGLREICRTDPMLAMIFHRLELVSWLGSPEHNADLFETVAAPSSELEGSLARMVLSYNMMNSLDNLGDNNAIASTLKDKIMEKLNVNSETRQGKYYGSESKYLEFKTSLVYPAGTPGTVMREDPAAQQKHILTRIAGMLNANGGRLYIGVNNDGYAVGLHDDFKYYERNKVRLGKKLMEIRDLDNLCVFLENLIDYTFGSTIARKIEVSKDEESEKDVILITVSESLTPVYVDGQLFVRQSGQSTREYRGEVLEEFLAERERLRLEQEHLTALHQAEEAARKAAEEASRKEQEAKAAEGIPAREPEQQSAPPVPQPAKGLATSMWRPNILHDYEEGYREPMGYIYFTKNNTLYYSSVDTYFDTDPDCILALAVPHELADAYLILGFAGESALRVPVADIIARGDNAGQAVNDGQKLMFATLAAEDDLLICLVSDSGNTVWRRAVAVGQMDNSRVGNLPRRLFESPATATVGWEVAEAAVRDRFASCMSDRLNSRKYGESLRVKFDDSRYEFKRAELAEQCHASVN